MRLAMIAAALLSPPPPPPSRRRAPRDRSLACQGARDLCACDRHPDRAGPRPVPALAQYLAEQFRAGGFTDVTVHPYDVTLPDDHTAALILRWPAAHPSGRKAMLLMGHMDVVEARREDWSRDPFTLGEADGYFYGRGTIDMKHGVTAMTTALLRLRAEGFQPDRDIIVLFTGDEENGGRGAELAANQWLDVSTIDFALNADAGGGAFLADGRLLGFGIQTAEKIYPELHLHRDQPGRPQLAAAAGQCDLPARPFARPAGASPLRAACSTTPPAPISAIARDREPRACRGDQPLARQRE